MSYRKIPKLYIYLQKYSKIFVMLAVLTIIGISYLLSPFINLININIDDSWVGVVGAIIGAIVGGILTMFASIYVHNNQLRAESAIQRKNIIYKPLYDELMDIKYLLDEENPYPRMVVFKEASQTMVRYPQYKVWESIKRDSRYLQVPQYLINDFTVIKENIESYLKELEAASNEVQVTVNAILLERYKTQCNIINFGETIIKKIMQKDEYIMDSYLELHALNPSIEMQKEDIVELNDLIITNCWELNSVKNLNYAREMWVKSQNELIDTLKDLITLINIKYEKHSSKFF
ncbi:hypothetical protein ACZ11_05800 [Lysinibacillus xylanilyticus]|uniref:Uncharacterized protein n=1 Tax=Lysinibacillus xylanilyticus TaxID=582475 RepID=A0A0K9FC71_9BACI|nr:hypothetical protein [Lysinibacillus xylanilyticus]KMY31716.1 hypothetical protein ACZ11_05800 [Lysinibacillus xylanilyticus]